MLYIILAFCNMRAKFLKTLGLNEYKMIGKFYFTFKLELNCINIYILHVDLYMCIYISLCTSEMCIYITYCACCSFNLKAIAV